MTYKNTQKIKEHLEFFGYTITDDSKKEESFDALTCRHPSYYTLRIYANDSYGDISAIVSGFNLAVKKKQEFLMALNDANYKANFTKWSSPKESMEKGLLVADTYFIGYDRQNFGFILEKFRNELDKYLQDFFAFTDIK